MKKKKSAVEEAYENPDRRKLIEGYYKNTDFERDKKINDALGEKLQSGEYEYLGGGCVRKKKKAPGSE